MDLHTCWTWTFWSHLSKANTLLELILLRILLRDWLLVKLQPLDPFFMEFLLNLVDIRVFIIYIFSFLYFHHFSLFLVSFLFNSIQSFILFNLDRRISLKSFVSSSIVWVIVFFLFFFLSSVFFSVLVSFSLVHFYLFFFY